MPESLFLSGSSAEVDSATLKGYWGLDPTIRFLNHGSFGACPTAVLERQRALRAQIEQEPVRFFTQELEPLLDQARQALAAFVGANGADLVFVPNATTGVNTVLRSLRLQPGDELLTTNHAYNACRNALNAIADVAQAQVVVAQIPFPIEQAEQVEAAVLAQVTPQTRLALIDHVTSQTGLIFPVRGLIRRLQDQGIPTLVDGAHAPGMVPLDLNQLGAAYYTGNCHKWLCAPKGAAFLHVRPDCQAQMRPLVISHGANSPRLDRSRFHLEFDWVGTTDPTAYLCIPAAIDLINALLPGGWPAVMGRNHQVAIAARRRLCQTLNTPPICPDAMLGCLASIVLPDGLPQLIQAKLFEQFQIEVPVFPWEQQKWLLRISAQLYNSQADYDELANALLAVLAQSSLGSMPLG